MYIYAQDTDRYMKSVFGKGINSMMIADLLHILFGCQNGQKGYTRWYFHSCATKRPGALVFAQRKWNGYGEVPCRCGDSSSTGKETDTLCGTPATVRRREEMEEPCCGLVVLVSARDIVGCCERRG